MSSRSLRAIHNSRKKKLEEMRKIVRDEEFNIKARFQEHGLLLSHLITFLDNRYSLMAEIKKEEAVLEPPDKQSIRVDTPTELYEKFKCYTTDRGIPMTEIIIKWINDYTLYCESEYKRIFSAKLEHRDMERAEHLRECRRINTREYDKAKRAKRGTVNPDDVEEDLPFDESPPYQGEE